MACASWRAGHHGVDEGIRRPLTSESAHGAATGCKPNRGCRTHTQDPVCSAQNRGGIRGQLVIYCQRTAGGKKLRYVGRACPWGVATEAPRSIIWLIMNLPLHSPTAPSAAQKPGYGRYELQVHSQTSPNNPGTSGRRPYFRSNGGREYGSLVVTQAFFTVDPRYSTVSIELSYRLNERGSRNLNSAKAKE